MPQISSAKINIQYAKAKESEGKYEEAAKAYETANDYDNIIRINLEHLNNPGKFHLAFTFETHLFSKMKDIYLIICYSIYSS